MGFYVRDGLSFSYFGFSDERNVFNPFVTGGYLGQPSRGKEHQGRLFPLGGNGKGGLTQVDHIQHACADDESELTVLRVVNRVGFVGEKHHFSNG